MEDDVYVSDPNFERSFIVSLKVCYAELSTVVILGCCFVLAALPLITLGAAILSITDTFTRIVLRNDEKTMDERQRMKQFARSLRSNLLAGAVLTVPIFSVVFVTYLYQDLAIRTNEPTFFIGSIVGLYLTVIAVAWSFRTSSLLSRSSPPPRVRSAVIDSGRIALSAPSYTMLQLTLVALLLVILYYVQIFVFVLPGILAIVEVVSFEELAGTGAERFVVQNEGQ